MLIVSGSYQIAPGKRDIFMQEIYDAGIPEMCRAEKGNLSYDYFYPVDSETDVYFIERWTDRPSWDAHRETPHVTGPLAEIKDKYMTGFEPGILGELTE